MCSPSYSHVQLLQWGLLTNDPNPPLSEAILAGQIQAATLLFFVVVIYSLLLSVAVAVCHGGERGELILIPPSGPPSNPTTFDSSFDSRPSCHREIRGRRSGSNGWLGAHLE